jgi:NTP pyrophosphatase (non-canonical NTP hydrolase)
MIKPMTKEESKRAIEKAKANRFNEYGNYGENNGPVGETKEVNYAEFVESMIITEGRDRLVENTFGLSEEAGEVTGKIKKFIRDGSADREVIQKELGDVIFYWYAMHGALGLDPEETIKMNMEKLTSRKERGVIRGSGDER